MDYSIRHSEHWATLANLVLHSPYFKFFYFATLCASLVCLYISFVYKCPPSWFYVLDVCINVVILVEVGARYFALQKKFWDSIWNKIDIVMALMCILVLFGLLFGECSDTENTEQLLEQLILAARNGILFCRSLLIIQKNTASMASHPIRDVDLDSVQGIPLTFDSMN